MTNVNLATSLDLSFLPPGRTYTLYATAYNSAGLESEPSQAVTYTTQGPAQAPVIVTQPVSQTVALNTSVSLSVAASGTAPLSYQWIKDGANIAGATASTYSISAVQAGNAGSYTVRVSNSAGSVLSSAATITVVVPPTITTQPLSQSVNVGSALALSVAASGTGPLSYQWIKDGANIASATTSTYSISAVQAGNAGSYTVRVSNSAGSVLSSAATITVVVPPTITTQPLSQSVNVGSALALSVAASGTGPLSYQWIKDGANIPGATTSTYSMSSVQATHAGSYSVRVSNSAGSVLSSTATIAVIGLPTIATQPLSQSVNLGSALTLSVAASGTGPLSYQWIKDGVNISGATASTYSVSSVQASHAGSYTVRVSNSAGSISSSAAAITVIVPPTITTQPSSRSVNEGFSVSLSVVASGTAPLTYQWLRNGATISGATAATFSIGAAQVNDDGSYTVRVSNSAGSVLSSAATITVVVPPTIATPPLSQSVSMGSSMTLSVVATGPAPFSYQWLKNGATIPGATAATFSIGAVQSSDAGSYTVRVSNSAGATLSSAAAITVVVPPSITAHPSSQSVNSGSALTLSVVASGTGPLSYQWLKNGVAIAGATGSTYSIAAVGPADAATYTVRVSNSAASVTSSSAIITIISPPVITTHPVSQNVNAGSSLSLSVSATGSAPLSFQWLKFDVNIPGATGPTFDISAVQADDAGSYSVRVSNPAGSVESSPATITVITPPAITTQPLSRTLNAGSSLSLTVVATGSLPLSYQWLKNGTALPGAISSSYVNGSVAAADAGSYTVRISNSAGTVTSSIAAVTIISPPVIISQPASAVVAFGAPVVLQVQASGSAPLNYQWSKDGTTIPGATNAIHNIASADIPHSGVYTVSVENPAGMVVSQPAILTVSLPGAPTITRQPTEVQVTIGSPFALSVEANGAGSLSYQWFRDGAPIPGGTSASYQIASAASGHAGLYNVQVSNIGGSTLSQSVRVTVGTPPTIITQPASQSVQVATPATFTVQAGGSAPLNYRWIRNGSYIPGATGASYTIASTRVTDEGAYQVEVSNTAGTVASATATLTVTGRPAITANPLSQTISYGGSFTVRVEATGAAPMSYRWIKDGTYVGGATSASYTISAADQSHAGGYSVEVSNLAGTITSQPAIITVLPPSAPAITLQPSGSHVELAAAFTLTVQATGSGTLSYQWLKNGAPVPGATGSSFNISSAQASDAGTYRVQVSNVAGSILSALAEITVGTAPSITRQPAGQSVTTGVPVTLSVETTGSAPLSYRWLKDGAFLAGATGTSYSIASVASSHAGTYTVEVSNPIGRVISQPAFISITNPTNPVIAPVITLQPQSRSADVGTIASFLVEATGTGPLTYRWIFNGSYLVGGTNVQIVIPSVATVHGGTYAVEVSGPGGTVVSQTATLLVTGSAAIITPPQSQTISVGNSLFLSVQVSGAAPFNYRWIKSGSYLPNANSSSFSIPAVQLTDAGSYSVEVSNAGGTVVSSAATIAVIAPPSITTQPLNQTLNASSSLSLTVAATGSLPLTYQWLKNGAVLPGATSSGYAIGSVAASDAGSYTVRISNSAGTVTSTAAAITIVSPPAITTQPASAVVAFGGSVALQVQASGSAPLSYQWSKDGATIPGATTATYNIASADVQDSGVYTVSVANPAGAVVSQSAILTVSLPGAPGITRQPTDVQVTVGSPFTLSVEASGTGPFSYQWFRDGVPIPGGTSALYQVASAASTDAGLYNVQVSNIGGSTLSQSVRVTVGTPPTIITQPASQSVEVATPATFTVQAAGSAPLTYRWIRNGSYVPGGASTSYTIASTRIADEGAYQVEISNSAGTIVSAPATLTITGRPAISANPQSQTINYGGGFTVRVEASGAAPLSYRWIKDGAYLAGATSASYSVSAADQSHGGRYSVEVSNLAGSVTSQPATVTVLPPSAPTITLQPIGTHVELGASFTLNVQATGSGTLSYQWLKNGAPVPGATSSSFNISSAQAGDAGTYRVQVSNLAGSILSGLAGITVGSAPAITRQPAAQSVTAGTPVTLSVEATGSAPLSYRWIKDGAFLGGATGSSYSIASATSGQAGTYTVEISNPVGRIISQPAFISITNPTNPGPVVTAPVITLQPQSRSANVGTSASFLVEATGTGPLTYRWIFNGSYLSGATNVEIVIPSVGLANSGNYAVEVSGPGGTVVSFTVTLQVSGAPAIVTPPQSQTISVSNSLFLSVQVAGVAPFTYRWIKSGSYIPNATSSTFSVPSVQLSDAGSYSVEVSNAGGTVISSAATVAVVAAPPGGGGTPTGTGPVISRQPASLTVDAGGSATFSVEATGTGPLTYRWIRNGTYVGGATSAALNIPVVSLGDAGSYIVEVSNAIGRVISSPASLTVSGAPAILSQPQSQATTIGRSVVLDIQVSGAGPMTYRWVKDGLYLPLATNKTFVLPAATLADAGSYYVEVMNGAGNIVSRTATVTVSAQGSYILRQPVSQTVEGSQTAILSVEAASVFELSFRWIRNGSYIPDVNSAVLTIPSVSLADGGNYSVEVSSIGGMERSEVAILTVVGAPVIVEPPPNSNVPIGSALMLSAEVEGARPMSFSWIKDGSYVPGGTNEVLMISAVSMSHAGNYTLLVSNSVGQAVSAPARVIVSGAPAIARQPQTQTVLAGSTLELDVVVQGAAPFSFRWIKGGTYIPNATNSTYTKAGATLQDAGSYQVQISNGAGSVVSQIAIVTIGGAPTIVQQPSNQTVPVGSPLIISLDLNGAAPFSFRWIKGGSYIPGATNATFQISSVTRQDAGSYSVEVSNGAGSVTSQRAVITVTDPVVATMGVSLDTTGAPSIQLSLSGSPGTYEIQQTESFGAPWQTLIQTNISTSTTISIPLSGSDRGFYRTLRIQP